MSIVDVWFKMNRWYDGITKPYRFLLALSLILPGILATVMVSVEVALAGIVYLIILLLARLVYLERF